MFKNKFIYIFLLIFYFSHSQNESNIWYFGKNAGLDFSSGEPIPISDSAMITKEGCSTICDTDGNLLFYTDGITVFNKSHEIMENGEELFGDSSSTSSSIILKQPNTENIYYIITCDALENDGEKGLNYSTVDINLNGGLGKVIFKNQFIHGPSSEKLTAIYNEEQNFFWIVSPRLNTDEIYSYKLTSSGIYSNPVISNLDEIVLEKDAVGMIKISPNGEKVAMAFHSKKVVLFDFNLDTGVLYNQRNLQEDEEYFYALEFSPNSKLLYSTVYDPAKLYQYDISLDNLNDIIDSKVAIPVQTERIGSLQLAKDLKIYCVNPSSEFISVINNPDKNGLECNFEQNKIILEDETRNLIGLPSYVSTYFKNPDILADTYCINTEINFTIPEYDGNINSITWYFENSETSNEYPGKFTFDQEGIYTIKADIETLEGLDFEVEIEIEIFETPHIIDVDNFALCINEDFLTIYPEGIGINLIEYQDINDFNWEFYYTENDAIDKINKINYPFEIYDLNIEFLYVRIENKKYYKCHSIYKAPVYIGSDTSFTLNDIVICDSKDEIEIEGPYGFDNYLWSTNETTKNITIKNQGIYSLSVWNNGEEHCMTTDDFILIYETKVDIEEIETKEWSYENNSINIKVKTDGDFEFSLDNIEFQKESYFENLKYGNHTVYIRKENGCLTIKEVVILDYPRYFSPNNDGIHDYWKIHNVENSKKSKLYIFDRYGKIITEVYTRGKGWDGKKNGLELPSSDYWFLFVKENGEEHRGHFTLKR
ncbi:T9SS type B sorting domain-containing protein [Aureivirga sp. CE67]|uniref:T9SS type B sorting domain-containing protein n=1 Tax=Aureivirga sp. CE67 TaxID=1788983 RepID=UPI0018CA773B|nr:T9SS type B sorting domain-containing protein [Aureivirga sp. CE67]